MSDKKSFLMYLDWAVMIYRLSDEEAGLLLKALYLFIIEERNPEFSGALAMAFDFMSGQIRRDIEKYEKVCERRSQYAKKPRRRKCEQLANEGDTDTDTVIVIDTDTDTDTEKETDTDTDTDKDKDTDTEPQSGEDNGLALFNKTMKELFER